MENAVLLAQRYAQLRHLDEAWRLLNAKRAPLILACAEQLFQQRDTPVFMQEAIQLLAQNFEAFSNDVSMEINTDPYSLAKKEWRHWLNRGLIVEKNNEVFATDALQKAIHFVKTLHDPTLMTSTASRLATVQNEIEHVFNALNPNQQQREIIIKNQIKALENELSRVQQGDFHVLSDQEAVEKIQNIYQLAMSLQQDFRRVEDSYRRMDTELREKIIQEQYHRGQIVNELLDAHEQLINTVEGRVFHSFNQALQREELDHLKHNIRTILNYPIARHSLNATQRNHFYYLTRTLNKEAGQVIRAKQRIERDVRNFIQTGYATEHHRVGELLKQIIYEAKQIDWQSANQRHLPSVLPPVGIELEKIHTIQRVVIKEIKSDTALTLDFSTPATDLADVDVSFWQALDGLDRQDWFKQTKQVLSQSSCALSVSELVVRLPLPEAYDMEAIAMWLEMAHATHSIIQDETETVVIPRQNGETWQFHVPLIKLSAQQVVSLDLDEI